MSRPKGSKNRKKLTNEERETLFIQNLDLTYKLDREKKVNKILLGCVDMDKLSARLAELSELRGCTKDSRKKD